MAWRRELRSVIVPTTVGGVVGVVSYWFIPDLLLIGSISFVWGTLAWLVLKVKQRSPSRFWSLEGRRAWWEVAAFGIAVLSILQGVRPIPVAIEYKYAIQMHALGLFALGYYISYRSGIPREPPEGTIE